MIVIWNRARGRDEIEQVYGESFQRFLYGTKPGHVVAETVSGKWLSRAVGWYQSSPMSARKIKPFIEHFGIDMSEFEETRYRSFNDFFIRKFRPGARPFEATAGLMPAFAEARYLAFERVDPEQSYPVKGESLSARAILGNEERAKLFMGGPMLIARLCPLDYHRFHYPDDGTTSEYYRVGGGLHSISPAALEYRPDILATNERRISILKTENFGRLAFVEVGALCVGKIVQTHPAHEPFTRGMEKGYFLFGASTVIVMGEPGAWRPYDDLLHQTKKKRETLVMLGKPVAIRPR